MNIKETKALIVDEIRGHIEDSASTILVDYKGITVAEATKLRDEFRKENVLYKVYKNTMIKRAFDQLDADVDGVHFTGSTAIAFGLKDAVSPAKVLSKAMKDYNKMSFKVGYLDGKVIDKDSIVALSELPSKEELIAKMLGSLNAPITGLVGVLTGPIRKLGYALNAVIEQKEAN